MVSFEMNNASPAPDVVKKTVLGLPSMEPPCSLMPPVMVNP